MTDYRVVYEDPDRPEDPAKILVPSPNWMKRAMEGNYLPPIWVYWQLHDDEQKAMDEGRHSGFQHDRERWELQFTAPRIDALTEEEAIEYLIMKDIPRRVWAKEHNRPMFKVVKTSDLPETRQFRNAWKMSDVT